MAGLFPGAQAYVRTEFRKGRRAGQLVADPVEAELQSLWDEQARLNDKLHYAGVRMEGASKVFDRTGQGLLAQSERIGGQLQALRKIANADPQTKAHWIGKLLENDAAAATELVRRIWAALGKTERADWLEKFLGEPGPARARGEKAGAATAPARDVFQRQLDFLDSLKTDTRGQLHAFGLLPELWNQLIELVKLGVRAGRSLRDAYGWATERFRARHPDAQWDVAAAEEWLLNSEERDAGVLREQLADERAAGQRQGFREPTEEELGQTQAAAAVETPADIEPEPARPHEPTQETKHWHKLRDRWFAAADNLTRLERRAEELRRTASVPPELRQELTFARKQYRELRKALNRSEEYVADTLLELNAIQRQIANARAAGIPERARELQFLLDGEIGRLDAIPPTILQRVWDRLVAEGRLPRPTSLSDSLSAAGLEREAQAERRRATQQAQPTPVTREEAAAGGAPPAGVAPPVAAAAQRRADAAVTAATSSSFDPKADLPTLWERFRAGLRKFASTVPEVPLFGEGSQYYMPMREFAQRVRRAVSVAARQAQEDVGQVLESLLALPKDVIQANALNRFQAAGRKARTIRKAYEDQLDALVRRLNQMAESPGAVPTARFQATQAELRRLQDNPPPALAQAERELAEAQDAIQDNPVHLFRQAVILRDLDWRARQLAQDEEHPFRLPNGVAHEDVLTELERIEEAIAASPHRAAIEAALDKHGALVANIRRELEARGEIIPAQFDNPFYFPHHILDFHTGRLAGAQPTTESPFRPYLITPVGSERAIESDYVLALYKHAADVRMHNAQVDAVQEVLKPLDISQQIKDKVAARAEAQGRTAYPNEWRSEKNLPPGYVFYDAAKKLTLRADEIIDRETLAKALGVQLAGNTPLREMLTRLGVDVKITPEMLRDALVAGEKQPWVIPAEMADALNGLERRFKARQFGESGAFGKVARTFTRLWKLNTLYNPKNWLRYEFGNTLTDVMDKLVGADPGMRRYLPRAWNEVRDFLRGGEGTPEIRRAFELGVLDTVTFNEVAKVKDSAQFNALMSDNQLRWATAKGLASFGLRGSNFRESLFRYAKFLADLERMRRGERPYYAGAYWRDAEWFETNEEKAAYISRRTFGDYQDVSVNGEYLRAKLIPFWSWTETNFRYHANALRNLADMVRLGEREAATAAGRAIAGRAAGTTAQAAGWALRLALPWIAVQTWNALSGLEDDLSEEDRRRFHIILGRDKEGRILVTYLNTAWGDVVAWFGGQRFAQLALDALHGRVSPGQAAVDWAKSAPQDFVNRAVQSTGPLVKTAYEAAARKRVFPDVFDQRGIAPHDQVWNIVENLTDRDAVSFLRRIADRDYYGRDVSDWLQQMVLQIRRRDPEQWAYYEAREAASDWKFARTGKRYEAGEYTSRDAEAVRNFKRALYRGDVAAANRFYGRLREYGYTEERLKATMRAQDPLADLTADERRVYEAGLDAKARRELALARTYYARLTGAKDTYRFPTRAQVEAQRARP